MPDKCLDCPVPSADMDGFIVSGPGGAPRSEGSGVSSPEGPFAKEAPQTGHVTIMGTLGADGNPGSLPDVPQVGWAYVAKDAGTYGGVQATEGDVVYCVSLNPVRWGVLQADSDDSGQDLVRASLSFSADPLPSLSLETETAAGVSSVQTVDVSALAVDESVLHKTGTETVSGEKVFSGLQTTAAGNASALLVVKDPNLVKGETPESNHYLSLGFIDSTGNSYAQDTASRLGVVEYKSPSEADPEGYMQMADRGFNGGGIALLRVGHDENNIRYATAPSTSEDRDDPADIVTRDYLPKSKAIPQFPDLWNWQKTEQAGSVAFKPVPESDLEPVVDFMFTEIPPAEGNKGPDNPSTITGVSSVKVTRCGKNLLTRNPISSVMSQRGITVTYNEDGSIHLEGTVTSNTEAYMTYFNDASLGVVPAVMAAGKTFTVSITCSDSNVSGKIYDSNSFTSWDDSVNVSPGTPVTHTMQSDVKSAMFRIMVTRGSTVDCDVYCQIEYGQAATEWETPADNAYTIQFGDTYYGGFVDFKIGEMTVTWATDNVSAFTATEDLLTNTVCFRFNTTYNHVPRFEDITSALCCNRFTPFYIEDGEYARFSGPIGSATTAVRFYIAKSRLDVSTAVNPNNPTNTEWLQAANAWLNSNPTVIAYKLYAPQTIQLTPTQIRSLPALDKYEPRINTVYTDQEAVQVGYQRFYDENRIAAVEARLDAIEAQLS